MSVAGYSTCRIQFIPNDGQRSERNYSDRSLVELRQYDFTDYSLRALDIENNREEIFNIPIKGGDQYKHGKTANNPDEIRGKNGTYRLWLNAASRNTFHEALTACIEQLNYLSLEPPRSVTPPPRCVTPPPRSVTPPPATVPKQNSPRNDERSSHGSSKPTTQPNRNDILVDVYQLGQYIRQGDADEAVNMAKKLAKKRVQLEANSWKQQREEKIIPIRVKIDSNDPRISNRYDELMMNVYPSTTVRELRTAFEYSEQFPPSNQYFFVNGHLAHENSTMTDLDVHPDSLFVLFIIQQ